MVVNAVTIPFIVQWREKKRKKDKLVLAIHKAMTPHLKMKSTKILQEEKFGLALFCEPLENRAFSLTTGFFVEKYETIIKGKKR